MPKNEADKITYRCPYCFNLANDVYLHKDGSEYYCLRCSFTGTVDEIKENYDVFRTKYKFFDKRIDLEQQRKM